MKIKQKEMTEGFVLTKELLRPFVGLKATMNAKEDQDEFNEYTVTITLKEISDEGLEALGITFGSFG
jgi:hypothetical protein